MYKRISIAVLSIFLLLLNAQAQNDTLKTKISKDSIKHIQHRVSFYERIPTREDSLRYKAFKPDPAKVVWMAAIIPGYGQIMNRKYWKLPIVYGAFLGCAYAISWNSGTYQTYLNAYRDIIDTDPTTTSYLSLIPAGRTIDSFGGISSFTNILKTRQDSYHRYRDLSIIATVACYALSIVDAYVDSQLYDFDISPDLTMHIQPTVIQSGIDSKGIFAMQCSINLK